MNRFAPLAALALLSACAPMMMLLPAPTPAAVTPAANLPPKERLVAAIAANNCLLTASNVNTILAQARISQPDLRALTAELAAEGRAEVSGEGTIRVLTDTCI